MAHWLAVSIQTQLIIASLGCTAQSQWLQGRQLAQVVPATVFQPGTVGNVHAGAVAFDPGLTQNQPLPGNTVVFLPADFLDGVIPRQREIMEGKLGPGHTGQAQA